jgi:hypothetical protein
MGEANKELPKATRKNRVQMKLSVINRSILRDGQAAAVVPTIANANLVDSA